MKLENSSPVIDGVCRAVEARLAKVRELEHLAVRIDVLSDFSQDARMRAGGCLERNPAYYDRVNDALCVHAVEFTAKSFDAQQAILAHEIAHCWLHRTAAKPVVAELVPGLKIELDEEIVVDGLASCWGYADELGHDRAEHYGEPFGTEYATLLRSSSGPDFNKQALGWHQRYLANAKRPSRT